MLTALIFLLGSTASNLRPANWECATPLIQKNYHQPYDSNLLARRIADECANEFHSDETGSLRDAEARLYGTMRTKFQLDIQNEIIGLRIRDQIKLAK